MNRSMSLPLRHLEAEKSNTKDKNRGSPVETSVFYDEKEDSHARFVIVHLCRDMRFPTMWHFDKCRLRRACAASF